jgi:hypothetical protein
MELQRQLLVTDFADVADRQLQRQKDFWGNCNCLAVAVPPSFVFVVAYPR